MSYEVRLRQMEKDRYQRLEEVAKMLREKTLTGAIEQLIDRFKSDQLLISELRKHSEGLQQQVNRIRYQQNQLKDQATEILRANFLMCIGIKKVFMQVDQEMKKKPARKPAKKKAAAKKKPIAKPRKK